jgi:hypothetical protein
MKRHSGAASFGSRSGTAVFKALAFLAGLGSAACGLIGLREILRVLSGLAPLSEGRAALIIAGLGFGVSLGAVAARLLRNR